MQNGLRKVLYVDDERENLDAFWRKFRKEYEVLRAGSGGEALDLLKANQEVPVLITDQRMPGMTGVELLERTVKSHPEIIRMILTGYTDTQAIIDAINTGKVYRYITKPWDENDMRVAIKNAVESYDLKKANRELVEELRGRNEALERTVAQRTKELRELNQTLEAKVAAQLAEIEKAGQLRRYLSPQLVKQVSQKGAMEQVRRKNLTVFFSDIRGFTSMSDSMEPEELIEILNEYFSVMTEIVFKHEGTLNKFLGDGMLVFFGDPVDVPDHAERAVRMSLEMIAKMPELNRKWFPAGHEQLQIGIGVNTGYVTVGNIGSKAQMDYTVIGNQVNLAARLQGIAKPGEILISQKTYLTVRDIVEAEPRGEISVKGIHRPVEVFNVRGLQR